MENSSGELTPNRVSTRNTQKINYAEMNQSGMTGNVSSSEGTSDDNVFRSPTASTRGRKRRPLDDSFSSNISASSPKRGRPRASNVLSRPTGTGRGGYRRVGADPFAVPDDRGLFGAVKSGRNLELAIDSWIEEYERDPDNALVKLQQFFISCCGCKGVLNIQMISTMEYSDIIRRMTEDFDEDSGDYPLVMPGPQWKRFRLNLHNLLFDLIDKCKSSIIFDQRMMDSVIQLLTGLADSQVRAFRHTATFAAMKISSALVDVTIEIVSVKEKNAKQIEAEKARLKNSGGTNEKLEMLMSKKNEIEEKTDDVRQMLQYIFKSVFVHRYRDVLPDTRSICITELGNWMMVYPEHFLEDSYLKYIGWSLYDKMADVRLKCINALLPLYDMTDNLGKLELFTNKFKDRFVSMVLDRDSDVAVRTCQLMTCVYRVFPSILQLKDCIPIYELVYCNHRGLAVAAGEFLNTKVFQHSARSKTSGNNRAQRENANLIKDLIQFYIEGECHEHASYLVDALIDTNPIIKDWQTQADLLLSSDAEKMETQLIEVLVCSVRQAATGESPTGRSVAKRGAPSTKESRSIHEDKTKLSEVLIPLLPQLLQKFIADRDKIANLITIPLHFQLEMFMASRLENYLNDLMKIIDVVVERHTDEEMMQTVASVINYFTTNTSVSQHTETYRLKLIDGLALQLRHANQRFSNEEQWDDEDEAAMSAAFRKIAAFVGHIDLKRWDLWDLVLNIIQNNDGRAPSDVIDKSIWFLYMQLNWDLYRLIKEIEPVKADSIKKLKKRRDQFVHTIENIITSGAFGVHMGFQLLADTLIMFNESLSQDGQQFEQLIIRLDNNFVDKIKIFVSDNVFSDAGNDNQMEQQEKLELMHKKRLILAQFCKLVINGVFFISDASAVLRYYCSSYTDFGDILKQLLYRCRDLDFVSCAKAVTRALIDSYESIRFQSPDGTVDPLSEAFHSMRDLAKRFSVAFGNDHLKNREAVASVHRDGIQFALDGFDVNSVQKNAPKNLSYLEVIMEFSGKLLRQDKQSLTQYLEKHAGQTTGGIFNVKDNNNPWEPLILYKNSLADRNADDVMSMRSFSTVTAYKPRGGRGRGRGRYTPTPSEMD